MRKGGGSCSVFSRCSSIFGLFTAMQERSTLHANLGGAQCSRERGPSRRPRWWNLSMQIPEIESATGEREIKTKRCGIRVRARARSKCNRLSLRLWTQIWLPSRRLREWESGRFAAALNTKKALALTHLRGDVTEIQAAVIFAFAPCAGACYYILLPRGRI